MARPSCQVRKGITAIDLETQANPCPMQNNQADHTIKLDNRRPNSIYEVQFISTSLFRQVELDNGSHIWIHDEPVIQQGSYSKSKSMKAYPGSSGKADEIDCSIDFCDATQMSGNTCLPPKEKGPNDLTYAIQIQ